MKKGIDLRSGIGIAVTVTLLMAVGGQTETPALSANPSCAPYFGETPPGTTKKAFAVGFIPGHRFAHGAMSFSSDGNEAYWSMFDDPSTFLILESHCEGDSWTVPAPVPFTDPAGDCGPFLSPDDNRLIFTSLRSKPPSIESQISFWTVERDGAGWTEPVLMDEPFLSATVAWQGSMTVSGDVYFPQRQVTEPDAQQTEEWDLARSRLIVGVYQPIEHLGETVNSPSWEFAPFIARDGSYLLFRSDRPGGFGRGDLWVSFSNPDGTWTEAQNLGSAVNTEGDEGYPSVSPDGEYLFFVSSGSSGYVYYWISFSVVEALRP